VTKEHILEEIRRTAKLNGGGALGKIRFLAETGIKESDWFGKYWVRWSDAVREAGFKPNQKNEAHADEWLIAKLVLLARELGHFPLIGDLLMKRRRDVTFPHQTAFRRFGSKNQLISKVTSYCQEHEGFNDVLALCQPTIAVDKLEPRGEIRKNQEVGYVYLGKSGRFYKIGMTNSAGRREWELAIQLPEKIKMVHVIKAIDDPAGIEEYWHRRFAAKRKNGEWFDLNAADVSAFRRRKFM
jgi:Meiotically up-regulated gene 113